MLFLRVKISCLRAKAHLVFHCCLYNKSEYVACEKSRQGAFSFSAFCCWPREGQLTWGPELTPFNILRSKCLFIQCRNVSISAYKKLMCRKMRQLLGYQSHFCQSKPSHDFCVWLVICLPRIFLTDLWNVSPVLTLLNRLIRRYPL